MKYFAKNILFLRKRKGLTQSQIPDFTGIGRATWSNYENGETEPNIDGIIRISEFFGVDLHSLLLVDLSEKVPIEQKEGIKKEVQKSTYENTHSHTPEGAFFVDEDDDNPLKQNTDLLILQQLNLLTKEIRKLAEKIDK